jgi:hypothetical protein
MNEATWLAVNDAVALLGELYPLHSHHSGKPQDRKSRMYLLACARRQWPRLPAACRAVVELAERFTDDPRGAAELGKAVAPVAERLFNSEGEPDDLEEAAAALAALGHPVPADAATQKPDGQSWRGLAALVYLPFESRTPSFGWVPPEFHSTRLLREVFGNPCRYLPLDPSWRTDTALALARQMYDARDFGAMPILADALQDAGCDSEDLLNHCRDAKQEHVRGCWVVDLVLDKR